MDSSTHPGITDNQDNYESYSSNLQTASALKRRYGLGLGFTTPTHLYFSKSYAYRFENGNGLVSSLSFKGLIGKILLDFCVLSG